MRLLAALLPALALAAAGCSDESRCERLNGCIRYVGPGIDGGTGADGGDVDGGGDDGGPRDGGNVVRDGGGSRDGGPARDGGDPNDCRVSGCGPNEVCNQTTFICECVTAAMMCGTECALCPADPGVIATGCMGADCVATMCDTGYEICGNTCCVRVPVWSTEMVSTNGGAHSSLIVDAQSVPSIAYFSDSPRGVHFRTRAGGAWSQAEIVDSRVNAFEPQLVDSNGPMIVHSVLEMDTELVATWRRNAGSWTFAGGVANQDRPAVAVGANAEILAAIDRVPGGSSSIIWHTRNAGTNLWAARGGIGTGGVDWRVAIDINAGGTAYAVYSVDDDLHLGRMATLASPFVTSPALTGPVWEFDVAVDANDDAHVVYYLASTHLIRYEVYTGFTRTRQVTVETSGGMAPGAQHFSGLSLALGPSGAHISYLDFSRGNPLVRYASDANGFVPETVGPADDILGDTSIAVDTTDAPHISYPWPSSSFSNLGYAVKR